MSSATATRKSGAGKGIKGATPRRGSKLKVDGLEGSVSPGGTTTIDVSVSRTGGGATRKSGASRAKGKTKTKGGGKAGKGASEEKSSDDDEEVRRWKEQLRREREQEDPRLREAEEAAARAAAVESKFDESKVQGGDEENAAAYENAPSKSFKGEFDWNSSDVAQQRGLAEANEKLTRRLAAVEAKARRLTDENEALRAGASKVGGEDSDDASGEVDARDGKIVELAKKVRRLTLERNRANGNASSLSEQLAMQEKESEKREAEIEKLQAKLKRAELGKASDSRAQELRSLTSTLDDLRVKMARKDNEVTMYRSALKKEIGDDFDLEAILQK